jgi:hypothetical protein
VNQLIITVESGHGNNTTPLILLESKVKGEVRHSVIFMPSLNVRLAAEMDFYIIKRTVSSFVFIFTKTAGIFQQWAY